jgi:hypothetical protein
MNNEYYSYLLYDPDDDLPFYAGKGKGSRALISTKLYNAKYNPLKLFKLKEIYSKYDEVEIEIVGWNLTEEQAFKLEVEAIDYFGLIKDNTGSLTNLTYGGDGISGWNHSEETKNKIGKIHKGRKLTQEHKDKLRDSHLGKTHTIEAKNKVSMFNKGKIHSEETRNKLSVAHTGKILSDETKLKISKAQKEMGRIGEKHQFYGKHHNEETKKVLRQKCGVPISINDKIYSSSKTASLELKMSRNTIRQRINDNNYPNYFIVQKNKQS